ncbi:peptidoglycan linked protein (LPXTG motif), pullulanase [Streptococcus uberis]|uniref:pullulanase n=1 Tax=Streptococcus uberis TaxID=1349 RepID=UPI000DA28F3D|nr:pullulanase [Streptococcus uberis]SQG82435.1 peptidoglycan linked protein (LPXTG motif), pullulanase [Streptococcus uberis]
MRHLSHKKQPSLLPEKRQIFSIRRLKVGAASVTIAFSLFFAAGVNVHADTVTLSTTTDSSLVSTTDVISSPPSEDLAASVDSSVTSSETTIVNSDSTVASQTGSDLTTTVVTNPTITDKLLTNDTTTTLTTNTVTNAVETPINQGDIRLHFQSVTDSNAESSSIWTWGAVANPSSGEWPTAATPFDPSKEDGYGHYLDITKASNPGEIGYVLLDNGQKVGGDADRKVTLIDASQNEAWIDSSFNTYTYQPLADENVLRINYKRADNNYDGWGVWLWGDVASASQNWPADALDFINEGKYGRYVDIPLSKGLNSNIGFLLVNQNDPNALGNKTIDYSFVDRENQSQIFLQSGDDSLYTNPYYVKTITEQDYSKAIPGTKNITVSASSLRSFNYNETGLIDISVSNPDAATITRMEVDTAQIGGGKILISPELNRVTITASSTTAVGSYHLPVRIYDADNGYYDTQVTVTINPRQKAPGEKDWDEQVIYFMMTDRFYNGDTSNDNPYMQAYDQAVNQRGVYQGGDFRGVTAKLDYLKSLGVSSVWLTPIVENVPQNVSTEAGKDYYAYHGYWASDFEKLNPHLGTLNDFHELIDQAAARGINIIVDVVLNHAGYGAEDKFAGMIRTGDEIVAGDDQKDSLSNLPDFKTEEDTVRKQLVAWQSEWLQKATTEKGNSIYAFRVDTVKHVDDTTWQHFKNELALKDVDFHLVGESWGANYKDTKGDLGTGTMDSLLDFAFKDIAKMLVNGQMKATSDELLARTNYITSNQLLSQFLGSHDEDGFLYSIGNDIDKYKLAVSLLLTSKGQPVIYYGEELGQSGANNWPYYDNRYDFNWDQVATSTLLTHYQKLLKYRADHSDLMAKGDYSLIASNDSQKWLLSKRATATDSAYILYHVEDTSRSLTLRLSSNATVTDAYSGTVYQAQLDGNGYYITLDVPSSKDGGTMILQVSEGDILKVDTVFDVETPIEAGFIRMHFKTLPSTDLSSLGLWTWEDVEVPSEKNGPWPTGATSFSGAKQDAYGYYLDIKMSEGPRDLLKWLINNTTGQNITGDQSFDILSQSMNEVWFDENYKTHYYLPQEAGTIRINYFRTDGNYTDKSLWLWGSVDPSVLSQLGGWPDGINFENMGKYGAYIDVKLSDLPTELGFLLLDESQTGDAVKINSSDYKFSDLKNQTQIFLKDADETIYTNPYFVNSVRMMGAQQISQTSIEATMTSLEGADQASLLQNLKVTDKSGTAVTVTALELNPTLKTIVISGDFHAANGPYTVTYLTDSFTANANWQYKDSLFAYDGELGARLSENGQVVDVTVWSPSAQEVAVVVYDKDDQTKVLGKVTMVKGDKGQWSTQLTSASELGISDYTGYYYHFEIIRDGKSYLVLDPYAKSLAAWNSDLADQGPAYAVAKAAFVRPSSLGPQLDFAKIDGFTKREDAIIYEAHVRDFTSDQAISSDLQHQFGTFAAFAERLDYLKNLGVTHIQLLPVMSYYFVNEMNKERLTNYASSGTNYNWGYDPQSYFALTGMYATDPTNPETRIVEFKNLINEIHKREMGIILDVVYNHTAKVSLFEDIEPNYYHFMDADGTARSSFGGGRLGTTHYMSRRVMLDSIKYMVNEYKVDGFRFDMMGDHDAASIEAAFNAAKAINPNIIMLGEGWVTYAGDANKPEVAADQKWMSSTDTVASFSDDMRNTLKSGFGNEGQPAFLTGGSRSISGVFSNIKGQPTNFTADDPGDVIQYIAAHDNLTLFDIIAQSIKKDPSVAENYKEILQRQRLGNLMILTSQGTAFIHSGQEYGRTKQFKDEAYKYPVSSDLVPNKSHLLVNQDGTPFEYPYFIHDSYDSTDAINHFDWTKAIDEALFPENVKTQEFTAGLIALRRSTDAFRLGSKALVDQNVQLITIPGQDGVSDSDLVIGYQVTATNGDRYIVLVNADSKVRHFTLSSEWANAEVLVDANHAGIQTLDNVSGLTFDANGLNLDALTATVLKISVVDETPIDPGTGGETPVDPGTGGETPVDPGTGGETPVDPGTGGETPVDPGTGGETPVDPGTGGETPVKPGKGHKNDNKVKADKAEKELQRALKKAEKTIAKANKKASKKLVKSSKHYTIASASIGVLTVVMAAGIYYKVKE